MRLACGQVPVATSCKRLPEGTVYRMMCHMRTPARTPIVLAVATMLLTGCGGSSGGDEPSDRASDSPSTPKEQTATTAQYASIVAENSDISEQLDTMESCDWLGSGSLDPEGSIVCFAGVLTLSFQAGTLGTSLESASKKGVPAFIGTAPSEIAPLVADTVKSAKALEASATAVNDGGCEKSADGDCQSLRITMTQDMNDLEREIRAWGPYL